MILVCGEALYDVFTEDGENSSTITMNARAGGSPFNVALGLARLGQQSALLTGISNDPLGQKLLAMLTEETVNTDYIIRTDRPTTIVMVSVSETGQPQYTFYGTNSADCGITEKEIPPIGHEISALHFGSYSLVIKPVADAFLSLLEKHSDRFISLDPNIRPTIEPDMNIWRKRLQQYATYADLIKISSEDMDYLYPEIEQKILVDEWLSKGVKLVVITDGGEEVRAWTQSGHHSRIKPDKSSVIDTVGAGDTFQAALLLKLLQTGNPKKSVAELEKKELDELIEFASYAASITCSRKGADLPRINELKFVV